MAVTTAPREGSTRAPARVDGSSIWYVGAVVIGAVLVVWTAFNQPYNQNEIAQITPYGSGSMEEITSGTRQPPLDPLLGAGVQYLLGEGQLQQRLVAVLAGVGALVLVGLLLRRLQMGAAGAFGLWVMATAPLLVRYSAYSRPYALPLFLILLFVFAAHRWLDGAGRRWLVVAAGAAVLMPLARVPEPAVVLLTTAAVVALLALRGRLAWSRAWPLIAIALVALVLVGYPMYRTLAVEADKVYDPSLAGMVSRADSGVAEILTGFLPLLADWMPWWPVTALVVISTLAIPASRRQLLRWWFIWPLVAAPVAFVLAYHFMNPYPFSVRPYRARFAIFAVPAYALFVVALASTVSKGQALSRRLRAGVGALLATALIGQLPTTAEGLTENGVPDFGQVADVLAHDLPDDAIVVYDTPSPVGRWRHPAIAEPRYMGDRPALVQARRLAEHPRNAPTGGDRPVYVLLLDGECAYTVVCDAPAPHWNTDVPGWEVRSRFDRFTLYEPVERTAGRPGVVEAMEAFGRAMGPRLGYVDTLVAAGLLELRDRPGRSRALLVEMFERAESDVQRRIREYAAEEDLKPLA